jgi:predicted peroxiredoxin
VGHIAPHDKLRQLQQLGAKIYVCGPSMDRFKVARDELRFPDVTIAEYLTFIDVMVNADAQLYV